MQISRLLERRRIIPKNGLKRRATGLFGSAKIGVPYAAQGFAVDATGTVGTTGRRSLVLTRQVSFVPSVRRSAGITSARDQ